jgi:myo-inositol-1(or 4)-monophosphatase
VSEQFAQELLELARNKAVAAGALLVERFDFGAEEDVRSKTTPTDLVSEADLLAERYIREDLEVERPEDGFVGEEGDDRPGTSGLRWVVDPLDGTVNFLFGIPQWCVSVAVEDEQGVVAGAIYDPVRRELFTGARGGEPQMSSPPKRRLGWPAPHPDAPDDVRRLAGPARSADLSTAMVATGFAYDASIRAAQAEVVARVLPRVRDIRRAGSAALDLAWTAAGRYDAFYERSVKRWDIAAGVLLCERAGLEVRELPAEGELPWGVLAAPPGLAEELYGLVMWG